LLFAVGLFRQSGKCGFNSHVVACSLRIEDTEKEVSAMDDDTITPVE
jgi:hypothetical protein